MGTKIATWSATTCGGSMSPSCRKNSPAPASSSSWRSGEAVFSFGKHAGASLREVAETAPGYLDWMLGEDFPEETLGILRDAKEGSFPDRDAGADSVAHGEDDLAEPTDGS